MFKEKCICGHTTADYIRFGNGKKNLLIIPGLSLTKITNAGAAVEKAYSLFTKDYTVYLLDRPDDLSGISEISDLADLTADCIISMGISPCDVIGISQGGMIALSLAAEHPGLIRALVLGSSCIYADESANVLFTRWRSMAVENNIKELFRDFCRLVYSPEVSKKFIENTDFFCDNITKEDIERFSVLVSSCNGFDLRESTAMIDIPVLSLYGSEDKIFSSSSSDVIGQISGSAIIEFPGCYHAVYDEEPAFKTKAAEFLSCI